MAYKLLETKRAKIHLEKLMGYLLFEFKNNQAAKHLLDEVKDIYIRLKEAPEQFPYCEDIYLKNKNYRKAVLSTMNYTVIFKIEEMTVYVIGIFHDSENYSDKL